ncbi:MAG TPA: ATP-binding cassette domain-containing protein [Tepidisphaeraceae bacterium]|jgi:ABC-type oligopeptide transport system ATPase subunit|nr:ATP-binding cassette domain-containing protein [Tepidisphaeraceae bacterium]
MNDSSKPVSAPPLLRVRHLSKHFETQIGKGWRKKIDVFKAVDNVSFDVHRGQTLGIVGESGSGKTTAVRCILRALRPSTGLVIFNNGAQSVDLASLHERQLKPLRQHIQMIFQDPFSSLNPRMTVGDIVAEPLLIHHLGTRKQRNERVAEMLEKVGLQPSHMYRYPHAFSGGQRQRIGIARALILRPALVVADEAVSALDVSVQARVLDLLQELQSELKLTYIFVSHDLSVIRQICDQVAVMHGGRIMELGNAQDIFNNPQHPYTRVLLSAIPYPDPDREFRPLQVSSLTKEQLEPLASAQINDEDSPR